MGLGRNSRKLPWETPHPPHGASGFPSHALEGGRLGQKGLKTGGRQKNIHTTPSKYTRFISVRISKPSGDPGSSVKFRGGALGDSNCLAGLCRLLLACLHVVRWVYTLRGWFRPWAHVNSLGIDGARLGGGLFQHTAHQQGKVWCAGQVPAGRTGPRNGTVHPFQPPSPQMHGGEYCELKRQKTPRALLWYQQRHGLASSAD